MAVTLARGDLPTEVAVVSFSSDVARFSLPESDEDDDEDDDDSLLGL